MANLGKQFLGDGPLSSSETRIDLIEINWQAADEIDLTSTGEVIYYFTLKKEIFFLLPLRFFSECCLHGLDRHK